MIDQNEIPEGDSSCRYEANYYDKFSDDTWKKLTALATSVFQSFKDTGYSKPLLSIGVTECEKETSNINWFFRMI